ncbi:hypothetical protein [Mesohalobacter halotolerans]|uniref:Uncharacterized protein n=1 Tax=Mesohalobacter halotolerans TaxID=1883405 RepID=A0A4U5TNV8_9FLAO|nr:hypothetical protein [Mesohalobacter halotolerans]TKS55720.1 hypothetical protein FCN74_10470 [Mesohalobacter halotolerans]
MKLKLLLAEILLLVNSVAPAQNINNYLDQYQIIPQMISQHPNGEWFISANSKGTTPQLFKLTPINEEEAKIDTLDYGFYLNISKLSNDGDHLLYAFADTIQDVRKTYLRTYENGQFSEPVDFRKMTGLKALTYFMVDKNENVYFYTYAKDPKGLYRIMKTDEDRYGKAELLLPNRSNYVPFSPLLLDEKTMLLAQHGVDDQSVNGIYVSQKTAGKWQTPVKIEDWPYGWSLGFDKNGDIIYINAQTRRTEYYKLEEVQKTLKNLI